MRIAKILSFRFSHNVTQKTLYLLLHFAAAQSHLRIAELSKAKRKLGKAFNKNYVSTLI